jgi:hypothetical protein
MAPQKLENNFLVSTLEKLLVFLVNCISIISYGKNSVDLRPTLRPALGNELSS